MVLPIIYCGIEQQHECGGQGWRIGLVFACSNTQGLGREGRKGAIQCSVVQCIRRVQCSDTLQYTTVQNSAEV